MRVIADLHIHSRHSRGCSKDLNIKNLEKYARIKGVGLLGTGDFTHPEWIKELRQELTEDTTGILRTGSGFPFVLQTEISLIYTQGGRGRKVHNVVLAPDFAAVDRITQALLKRGRVDYDGRPIFKIPCPEFVRMLREIDTRIEVIPAHIWTPHFAMFGSNSGFDSLKECFGDQAEHIHAIETGLSSDPPMNWRLSGLDLIRTLRAEERDPDQPLPVLAITAYVLSANREEIYEAGADGILAKPIMSLESFGEAIGTVLQMQTRARHAPATATDAPPLDSLHLERLLALAGDANGRELLERLRQDFRTVQSGIQNALSAPDFALLRARTHVLISLSGAVGAEDLQTLAEALNAAAHGKERMIARTLGPRVIRRIDTLLCRLDGEYDRRFTDSLS